MIFKRRAIARRRNIERLNEKEAARENLTTVITRLNRFWAGNHAATSAPVQEMFKKIFVSLWEGNETGNEHQQVFEGWGAIVPDEFRPYYSYQVTLISCAYAVQGIKALNENELIDAVDHLQGAIYWLGMLIAPSVLASSSGFSVAEIAKLGADKRHVENREMKADAFRWLDDNMHKHKSIDSAAEAIFGKVVPVKFRTAQKWTSQWKKLRSTGTA